MLTEKVRTRRWKVGFTTPETRWLRARRAAVQGLFRSPQFCARPYWDAAALADAFDRFCDGEVEPSQIFWRAINTEIWMRVFFDHDGASRARRRARPTTSPASATSGWRRATNAPPPPSRSSRRTTSATCSRVRPSTVATTRARRSARGCSSAATRWSTASTDALRDVELAPDDVVAVSEKAVAICQGRSYPVDEVHARPLARVLSRFVGRTASGIGLGIPATMELAIREAGEARILGATAAAAVTKPFGVKGVFYRVAGPAVRAIDGPTQRHHPARTTATPRWAPTIPRAWRATWRPSLGVGVAVIDANDIGVNVLGVSSGVDATLVESLLRDNPLGQGAQQTPVALLRPV